ncbi:MAG: discoidin domain-containing protein, partial [Clostridia bacterium]|nr:discoidin domain-containing protein [Clostridia bacterium]
MKKILSVIVSLMLIAGIMIPCFSFGASAADTWRSALYPVDWVPGYQNSSGQFLHDFSYAGYMMGEQELPTTMSGLVANVLDYGADGTGANDSTSAIQSAINAVQNAGGGTVYLPAGTYKVKPTSSTGAAALKITGSNILFKGDGIGRTFIRGFAENMRSCQIINVSPSGGTWDSADDGNYYYLSQDIGNTPTNTIHLNSVGSLAVGDWIILRSDRTEAWINEHSMSGFWYASVNPTTMGTTFYRRITAVDANAKTITIDIPTRYYMKTRDNARVYKVTPKQSNVGLMDFSIGNKMNSITSGWGEEDYNTSGTGAYNVHSAFLIKFGFNVNCFAKNIASYQAGNASQIHMSSNGLDINKTRNLTIENCDFSYPQYEGGGGNGYGMNICGQETLIKNCSSTSARHSFSFKYAYANGNVIYHYTSTDPKYGSDFHMYLSMSNLIDNEELNGDFVESNVRPYGGTAGNRHGYTSTQTVFWNTKGNYYKSGSSYIIDSRQFGYGYIIGTQGAATAVKTTPTTMSSTYGTVNTAPEDYKEGIGTGATLEPQSLYYDQLERRLNGGAAPEENPFTGDNLALNKNVTVSGTESSSTQNLSASNAVDGNTTTRWASTFVDPSYITVDLADEYVLDGVRLNWEAAYATSYRVDVSSDGTNFTTVYTDNNGDGGIDNIELDNVSARYVRMYGLSRATTYGYSLYEFEVYGNKAIAVPATFNSTEYIDKSSEISNNTTYVGNLVNGSYLDYLIDVPTTGNYT